MRFRRLLLSLVIFWLAWTFIAWAGQVPFLDWQQLQNPILAYPDWSIKDACLTWHEGNFYCFFSAFYWDRGEVRSHVVGVRSPDLVRWSAPLFNWSGAELGWRGACSPDITRLGEVWYLTFNRWGDEPLNQLFYATSCDLIHWETYLPLATNLTNGIRAIDAALACHKGIYYLAYKERQTPTLATAEVVGPSGWRKLGQLEGAENYQLLLIDSHWYLLWTKMDKDDHHPCLARMKGSGDDPEDWLAWQGFRRLKVPREPGFDQVGNAASLVDWRAHDGYFYLLYAQRVDQPDRWNNYSGRGYNRLGLARSHDLMYWEVPPGRA